jgi:hypothetical protein
MFDERSRGLIPRGARAQTETKGRHPYMTAGDAVDLVTRSIDAYKAHHKQIDVSCTELSSPAKYFMLRFLSLMLVAHNMTTLSSTRSAAPLTKPLAVRQAVKPNTLSVVKTFAIKPPEFRGSRPSKMGYSA